jgi:two-component system, OmpR family, response regulator
MTTPEKRASSQKLVPKCDTVSILLADDAAVLRHNIRKLMSNTGITLEIHEAETVCDALCYLRRHTMDLLILDLQFPDGTGFDVLKQLSLLEKQPLVVVLTNFPSEANHSRARMLGADHFLDKSYEYEQVLSILEQLCLARSSGQENKNEAAHTRRQR